MPSDSWTAFLTGPDNDPNLAFGRVTRAWSRFGVKLDPGPAPEIPDRGMLRGVTPEIEGVRALYQGRHADAAELFAQAADAWYPFHRRGWIRSSWARGEALRLAGDLDAAIPALREAERRADELGFVVTRGVGAAFAAAGRRAAGRGQGCDRRRAHRT